MFNDRRSPALRDAKGECIDPRCTRMGVGFGSIGKCVGYHCPTCDAPVGSQGHNCPEANKP